MSLREAAANTTSLMAQGTALIRQEAQSQRVQTLGLVGVPHRLRKVRVVALRCLWNHSNGALSNVWKTNASGSYQSNVTNTMAQNETTFEVDLDGDGFILEYRPQQVETNGDYELAHGGHQYYIIDDKVTDWIRPIWVNP